MKVILSICKEHNKKQKTKNKTKTKQVTGRYNTNNVKITYKQYTRLVNGIKTISGYVH